MKRGMPRWPAASIPIALVLLAPIPTLGSTPRPGPDLLHRKAAKAPQLENRGPWRARPILVSGASAYRRGEFLYQDFLYDDHGARFEFDPSDSRADDLVSQPNGTYVYPRDPRYANNAADLVEFRVKPLRRSTAFRLTLNTMKDPALVAATIAIGSSKERRAFPHGANASAPAALFLTVHGREASLQRAATGDTVRPLPRVYVSERRRQIDVRIPHRAWNPRSRTVRFAVGVGLWDDERGRYLLPQRAADTSRPGGAGSASDPPAFFNVGFRATEPLPEISDVLGTASDPRWWRDSLQARLLAGRDISALRAEVSFAKLRARVRDNRAVPGHGPLNRILASHFEPAQGVDYGVQCFPGDPDRAYPPTAKADCPGSHQGRLQPYAIYVPRGATPERGYGLTLLLHGNGANYNQDSGSRHQQQLGDRGGGSIVVSPHGRGPDGLYENYAAADVFEVWADVRRHYRLDSAWSAITGYSMGGIGTFKLAVQFPDLFGRAHSAMGFDEWQHHRLISLRHVPVLMWNGAADESINPQDYVPTAQALDALGYRYELDVFHPGEHLSLAINDEFGPAADFLGSERATRNPARVTYAVDAELDEPELGVVGDHAYWLSGLRLRSGKRGMIDAVSYGFGRPEPTPSPTRYGAGTLRGGRLLDPYPFTSRQRNWLGDGSARVARRDRLQVTAQNIREARVDVARARLTCEAEVAIESDGPFQLLLSGCDRTVRVERRR